MKPGYILLFKIFYPINIKNNSKEIVKKNLMSSHNIKILLIIYFMLSEILYPLTKKRFLNHTANNRFP